MAFAPECDNVRIVRLSSLQDRLDCFPLHDNRQSVMSIRLEFLSAFADYLPDLALLGFLELGSSRWLA